MTRTIKTAIAIKLFRFTLVLRFLAEEGLLRLLAGSLSLRAGASSVAASHDLKG
jgi:hypothetical protein